MSHPIVSFTNNFQHDWYCILHLARWNSLVSVINMYHDCSQLCNLEKDKANKSPHLLQWRWDVLGFLPFFDEIRRIDSRTIRICRGGEILNFFRAWKFPSFASMTLSNPQLFANFPRDLMDRLIFYWRYHVRRSERTLPFVPDGSSKVTVWWSAQDASKNRGSLGILWERW